jgi:hypothetical protein
VIHRAPRRRRHVLLVAAALLVALAGCSSGPAADSPAGVVTTAVDLAAKKDVAGLQALACAGEQDAITNLIGLPTGLGSALLPGVDIQSVIDAIRLDTSGVKVGAAVVTGDEAQVPLTGSVKVTFDKATMRPIVEKLMAARGTPMSSDQLDGLLQGLQDYGQDVPLDQQVRVVREQGAWKICPTGLVPVPSGFPLPSNMAPASS